MARRARRQHDDDVTRAMESAVAQFTLLRVECYVNIDGQHTVTYVYARRRR